MNKNKSILSAIADLLLGKKYYANIINTRGTFNYELSCFIFHSREEADRHKETLEETASFRWIETISFRSREKY